MHFSVASSIRVGHHDLAMTTNNLSPAAKALIRWGGFDSPRADPAAVAECRAAGLTERNRDGRTVLTQPGFDAYEALSAKEVRHG